MGCFGAGRQDSHAHELNAFVSASFFLIAAEPRQRAYFSGVTGMELSKAGISVGDVLRFTLNAYFADAEGGPSSCPTLEQVR